VKIIDVITSRLLLFSGKFTTLMMEIPQVPSKVIQACTEGGWAVTPWLLPSLTPEQNFKPEYPNFCIFG